MVLPGWAAVMLQVPTARRVTVDPVTVQMVGELLVKDTGRPEVAVALTVNGPSSTSR